MRLLQGFPPKAFTHLLCLDHLAARPEILLRAFRYCQHDVWARDRSRAHCGSNTRLAHSCFGRLANENGLPPCWESIERKTSSGRSRAS